jgi:hypothetical protein
MATHSFHAVLQGYLKVTSDRQQMVASNIANRGYTRLSRQGHQLSVRDAAG